MDLKEYLKKYGNKSFKALPLTDADKVIFTFLSYINFSGVVSKTDVKKTLKDVANQYFEIRPKKEVYITAVGSATEILRMIKDYPRYQSIELYNYVYITSIKEQFGALFIDFDEKHTFIAFEGTDDLISGWKEDCELAYRFPVPSHTHAINYVNKNIPLFTSRKYIIGGHSKGGNLAEVAAMYMKKSRFKKVIKVYSLDGPGLREKEFFSNRYKRIDRIFELIIPESSVVGLLLKQKSTKTIVKSKKKGLLAHDAFFWLYDDTTFKKGKLSEISMSMDRALDEWLDQYPEVERKRFIEDVFHVLDRAEVDSLLDLKENTLKSIKGIIKESSKLDPDHRDKMISLFKFIIDCTKEEFFTKKS